MDCPKWQDAKFGDEKLHVFEYKDELRQSKPRRLYATTGFWRNDPLGLNREYLYWHDERGEWIQESSLSLEGGYFRNPIPIDDLARVMDTFGLAYLGRCKPPAPCPHPPSPSWLNDDSRFKKNVNVVEYQHKMLGTVYSIVEADLADAPTPFYDATGKRVYLQSGWGAHETKQERQEEEQWLQSLTYVGRCPTRKRQQVVLGPTVVHGVTENEIRATSDTSQSDNVLASYVIFF